VTQSTGSEMSDKPSQESLVIRRWKRAKERDRAFRKHPRAMWVAYLLQLAQRDENTE
jgi:hypothetical protein